MPKTASGKTRILALLCLLALLASGAFWLSTAQQPLIDQHDFRQTQTALSALFMQPTLQGILNYETPVVGSPWSIPFEFPLYQATTALIAAISPWPLSSIGRIVAVAWGLACIIPAWGLMATFQISRIGRLTFVLLDLTSSIYVYWNRAFMIESTALFLTLSSLYYYSQIRRSSRPFGAESSREQQGLPYPMLLGLSVSLSLGLVVKATTALPALLLMGLDWLIQIAPWRRKGTRAADLRPHLVLGACLLGSFLILAAWIHHGDSVKSLNPIGSDLTSGGLNSWNYGTPWQRLSPQLWSDVVITRMLTPLGAIPAIGLIAAALVARPRLRKPTQLIGASLFLTLTPLLIFTNLHIVHNYYQAGNQIYLLIALAGSVDVIVHTWPKWTLLAWCSLALIIAGNIQDFTGSSRYLESAQIQTSDKLAIGRLIDKTTAKEAAIIVYGDDWSSAFAFHSKRRALTIPTFFKQVPSPEELLRQPEVWVDGRPLAAVISDKPLSEAAQASLARSCPGQQHQTFNDWQVYVCPSPSLDNRPTVSAP